MEQINVNEILEGIRSEIKEKGYIDDEINFSDVNCSSLDEIHEQIEKMKAASMVNSYRDVSSDRKVIGGLFTFVKKVIRRLTCFYVEPIVDDQNQYNTVSTRALELLCIRCEEEIAKNAELERRLHNCQRKLEKLETEIQKMNEEEK